MNKRVTLAAPMWMRHLNRAYSPTEGAIVVTPHTADVWKRHGLVRGEPEDTEDEPTHPDLLNEPWLRSARLDANAAFSVPSP